MIKRKSKICGKCIKRKKIDKFYKTKSNTDGYSGYCKPCANKATVCIRNRNINKVRKYQREQKRKWYSKAKNKIIQSRLSKEYLERKRKGLSKPRPKRKVCK